ncbi:MAG: hypothetical protein ACO2ZM_06460 [Francisellaceae bacterium]
MSPEMPPKSLKSVAQLLSKRTSTLAAIKACFEQSQMANAELSQLDVPYFKYVKAVYFDGRKLILSTEIPELLSKFRENQEMLIRYLNRINRFRHVDELVVKLHFSAKKQASKSKTLSISAISSFKTLADHSENDQIKQAIAKLIHKGNP